MFFKSLKMHYLKMGSRNELDLTKSLIFSCLHGNMALVWQIFECKEAWIISQAFAVT